MWNKISNLFSKKIDTTTLLPIKKILIVDDSEIDRKIIMKLLNKANFRLLVVDNGEAGLKVAKEEKPDLILLDCVMPGLSGPEVCQQLKTDSILKSIPIIFLTSMDSPTNVINCYDIGADHYLRKPINSKELITQIKETLKDQSLD